MKRVIGVAVLMGILISCNKGSDSKSTNKVSLVKEAPMYIKDRQLEDNSENKIDPHGSKGAGYGFSYASRSYRQSAIKHAENKNAQETEQVKHRY